MRLKKSLTLLLAVFLLPGLCACAGADGGAADFGAEESAGTTPAPTGDFLILEWADDPTEVPEDRDASGSPVPAWADAGETVLLDEMDVKITATGIDYKGWAGPALMLAVENHAGETLVFACEDVYVNGCKVINGFYAELDSGEESVEAMTLYSGEMTTYGIDTIAEIAMIVRVADEDWNTYCETGLITLRPDAPEDYTFTFDPDGEVLYDEGGFRIIGMGRGDDDIFWDPSYLLYFENNTDRPVTFETRGESVNGSAVTGIVLSTTLFPGMRAVKALTLGKDELEQLGVDEIETLGLRFLVFDTQTGGEILTTDESTIDF